MNERETEIFRTACKRLSLVSTKAPELFGVTRQTYSSWMNKHTKVPHKAFIALLEIENRDYLRTTERMEQIRETAERINKAFNISHIRGGK